MKTRALPLLLLGLALAGCRPHTGPRPPATSSAPPSAAPATTEPGAQPGTDRMWLNGSEDVAVIMYHDVVPRKQVWFDLTTREFERQMAALKEAGANVARMEDVVAHFRDGKPLPPKTVVLTFDDNTLGIYENAFPVMQKYGFPSLQFVHTAMVGVKTGKDHCTWEQLKEMQDSGLVEIGSHTVHHPADIRELSDDEARAELSDSKTAIEANMGRPCRYLAYTEGNADERIAAMVEEDGYEAAFNEQRAWLASPADRLFLPRFAPFRFDNILDHWKASAPSHPGGIARVALKATGALADAPRTAAGVRLTWYSGDWQSAIPAGRGLSLLGPDGFAPAPVERQWSLIGAPLIVSDGNQAISLAYQPWLGTTGAPLNNLLPGATFAIVGSAWLLHNGQPVPGALRTLHRPLVIGWTADGHTFTAGTRSRVGVEDLAAALQKAGAVEAIAL